MKSASAVPGPRGKGRCEKNWERAFCTGAGGAFSASAATARRCLEGPDWCWPVVPFAGGAWRDEPPADGLAWADAGCSAGPRPATLAARASRFCSLAESCLPPGVLAPEAACASDLEGVLVGDDMAVGGVGCEARRADRSEQYHLLDGLRFRLFLAEPTYSEMS